MKGPAPPTFETGLSMLREIARYHEAIQQKTNEKVSHRKNTLRGQ